MLYLAANWKMNGSKQLLSETVPVWQKQSKQTSLIVCPPATLLDYATSHYPNTAFGAQDCHSQTHGAYTGNLSATLLKEVHARYALVGHSERRQYQHETNEEAYLKAQAALAHNIIPIVCVGETKDCRDQGNTKKHLEQQLQKFIKNPLKNILLAYEPIWAIGTGVAASIQDIAETHGFLKNLLGKNMALLYGGSVNQENAHHILKIPSVNGLLVGGASLKVGEFSQIIQTAEEIASVKTSPE